MVRMKIRSADGTTWSDDLVSEVIQPSAGIPLDVDSLPLVTAMSMKAVGHCIYCNVVGVELTREHIVPFGLGGTFVLPGSSCKKCASITSAFERKVLRGPMRAVRAHLQMQSRRASLAPKSAPLTVIRGVEEETIELPLAQHPLLLMFPRFAEPSIFSGKPVVGIGLQGHATYCFGKSPTDVMRDLNATDFRLQQDYDVVPFAQLLGKIAWAMAGAEGRLASLDPASANLAGALIESPDDIGKWVGTFPEWPAPQPGVLHAIVPMEIEDYLVYHIQLFADAQTPRYGVVVGKLLSSALTP